MSNAQRARGEAAQARDHQARDHHAAEARRPAPRRAEKSATAFRTISEVADDLEVPQHVLRFWETKFPQIRPMKRGGGRRYYRPEDIELLRQIRNLLYEQGYTIKGVQKLMREGSLKLGEDGVEPAADAIEVAPDQAIAGARPLASSELPLFRSSDDRQLREIRAIAGELADLRDRLRKAIER
ncbi:MAG TPA: MerR family transcriptional regulator [Candidatus Binatia bacterium]|nr:MerR family transcriptional regulator [Candidatus Binatia bacterium]